MTTPTEAERLPMDPSLIVAAVLVAVVTWQPFSGPVQRALLAVWPNETAAVLVPYVAMFAAVGYATKQWGRPRRGRWVVTSDRVVVGMVVPIGLFVADVAVGLASRAFGLEVSGARDDLTVDTPALFLVVAGVIVAPILEELVFRGWLLCALTPRIGKPAAVAASSLVFAAAHIVTGVYGWYGFVILTITGAVFAVTVLVTGSLIPTMVAHATINLFAVLVPTGHGELVYVGLVAVWAVAAILNHVERREPVGNQ